MKKLLFTSVLIFVAVMGIAQTSSEINLPKFITDKEALDRVKSLFEGKDVDYYIGHDMQVQSAAPMNARYYDDMSMLDTTFQIAPEDAYQIFLDSIVIFVDEEPMKGWEHKCSIIKVPVQRHLSGSSIPYSKEDLTMPPSEYMLRPVDVKNRYGSNAELKIRVPKLEQGSEQNANTDVPLNTYAVILSGGVNRYSNYERYWNDCSYIYQTLVNKYNIPKDNIIPIIADGTDPGKDMRMLSTGEFVSSPLDLDFDGEDDIKYAATKTNVINVLNDLAGRLEDDAHLFLYVIDHGGSYDYVSNSYICLWNNERLDDTELASALDKFNVRSINVLLGQCFSGGFIDNLQKSGRVIATACTGSESSWACPDIPYDEFVFKWTSAVNERNILTSMPIASDVDKNGYVGMDEAFNYAKANDVRDETPLYSSVPLSVGEDLAFNKIPLDVDLYLKDNDEDTGKEPNLTTDVFWNSPDIWVRNQKDGFVNQESEPVKVTDVDQDVYIYFRVHNRGSKDYPGYGMYIHPYWADASLMIGVKTWLGEECENSQDDYGGPINVLEVDEVIPAGSSRVFYQKWTLPRGLAKKVLQQGEYLHVCLLNKMTNSFGEQTTDKGMLYRLMSDLVANKCLVQKNLTIIKGICNYVPLNVRNDSNGDRAYNIEIMKDVHCKSSVFDKIEVSMNMSEPLLSSWQENGMQGNDLQVARTNSMDIRMLSENSRVENINVRAAQVSNIAIKCNQLACVEVLKPDTALFHVVQRDAETGKIVGGEAFMVITEPRQTMEPYADYKVIDGKYELNAGNVKEKASYEWYDADNNLVGRGKNITLPAEKAGEYKVRVVADKDGAVSYANVSVGNFMKLDEISPLPFSGNLNIKISAPATGKTKIRLTSTIMSSFVKEYTLNKSETELNIDTSQYQKGIYLVSLIENNVVVDIKRIINK